jgi:transposase-like protein/IS1 family transposase
MEELQAICCPECLGADIYAHTTYTVQSGARRTVYACPHCGIYFSETYNTPLAGLRHPISFISRVIEALNDGLGINAACRTFQVGKNTLYRWLTRLADLKEALLLYALCHQFIQQRIEGDELYTRVHDNAPPDASVGWTIVLMDRATRFIWELQCGPREASLFENAMQLLRRVIAQTDDLTLLTDGERRYGNLLFALCMEALHTGHVGRPRHVLPPDVKVRVKNKGDQAHKRGPKRPKYQAPWPEHPQTPQDLADREIHANHLEAFNSALRRRLACYRRRTNTYAKLQPKLQCRLDVHWILHDFVRRHFTTKQVPAVALGILDAGLSWADLFRIHYVRHASNPT